MKARKFSPGMGANQGTPTTKKATSMSEVETIPGRPTDTPSSCSLCTQEAPPDSMHAYPIELLCDGRQERLHAVPLAPNYFSKCECAVLPTATRQQNIRVQLNSLHSVRTLYGCHRINSLLSPPHPYGYLLPGSLNLHSAAS